MWGNIKLYAYGAVMFIITALGVWIKMLSEQKKSLKKDNEAKDQQIEQSEQHNEQTQEAREEEQTQSQIASDGEEAKDEVEAKVIEKIKNSNISDVKVTL